MELFEAKQGFQLFVDLDGVLADFEGGAARLGAGMTDSGDVDKSIWKLLHSLGPDEVENWWATLDWAPGGQELWNFVKKYDPTILSSPDIRPGFREACEAGKTRWISTHLHPKPPAIFEKDKWKYATRTGILIDDYKKKIIPWEEHGGAGIHHRTGDAKSSIKQLIDRFGFPRK